MQLSLRIRGLGGDRTGEQLCSGKHAHADPLERAQSKRIFYVSTQKHDHERRPETEVAAEV